MEIFSIDNLKLEFPCSGCSKIVLNNLSLKINHNSLIAIVGKSGCGKSSFLNCLSGLIKPTSGNIYFRGKNINKLNRKEKNIYHNQKVSMIFQHYNLFEDFSSLENVIFPLLIKGININKAKDIALPYFKKFNLDYLINKKVMFLSGGEKQRIAIIRALINDSEVILCDEPTGALDEENSVKIMEILKEISSKKVVIVVSHNKKLIEKYSDRIIELDDGKIVNDHLKNKNINSEVCFEKKYFLKKEKISNLFIKRLFKKNIGKNILTSCISFFGFLFIFLSIYFFNGTSENQDKVVFKNLDAYNATIANKTYQEIPNSSLVLEKNILPTNEEVNVLSTYFVNSVITNNYDYFFPTYPSCYADKELINNVQFHQIYNNPLIDNSVLHSLEDAFINEEMYKLLNNKKEVVISNNCEVKYHLKNSNETIKDSFSFYIKINVKNVIKEFSFLNGPKIYISFEYMQNYLKDYVLSNISNSIGEEINVVSFLNICSEEKYHSYSKRIFFKDFNEAQMGFNYIKNNESNLKINSSQYEISDAYIKLMNSFSSSFIAFSIICFGCLNLIIGISSMSTYFQNKKESAILSCLGLDLKDIRKIYTNSNIIIAFLTSIVSFVFSLLFSCLINSMFSKILNLPNVLISIIDSFSFLNLLIPFLVIIFGVFISYLFVYIPLLFNKRIDIVNELKDE